MAKYTWTTDERITKTLLDKLLYESADGESCDDLTKLAVKGESGSEAFALEIRATETLSADRVLTVIVGASDRTLTLSGNANIDQDMQVGATPTFVSATLSGLTASKPVFSTAGKVLTSSGTLAADQGGTGQGGGYAVGDLLYASAAGTLSKRAAVATGQVLSSAGTTTAPVWSSSPTFASSVQSGRGEVGIHNFKDETEITMDTNGELTVAQTVHKVLTFAGAASDNLEAIIGGAEGDTLIIRPSDAAKTIVALHSGTPTSGLAMNLAGGGSFTMDENNDFLMLIRQGSLWQELGRSENHA